MKTIAIKVGEEVVSFSFRRFSRRVVEDEIARINHKIELAKKKKGQLDIRSQILQQEINTLNRQLLALTAESVKALLEEAEREDEKHKLERHLAHMSAEEIMREFFGQTAYEEFMKAGEYLFTAVNGETYKINISGTVFREEIKENERNWVPVCLIRPRELPLPDFLLAALVSVKQQPTAYQPVGRRQ